MVPDSFQEDILVGKKKRRELASKKEVKSSPPGSGYD
jgi:hypothetical protein